MWTQAQVAATIDHAVLKPFSTDQDVLAGCELCKKYQTASLCVRPSDTALAIESLKGSPIKTCVVVGFPHGSNLSQTKATEAQLALEQGAAEIDMVMNIGQFLSGHYDRVQADIESVVSPTREHNGLVKVILETCYLSDSQIETACKLAEAAGADFVKTSTGFGSGAATPQAVAIMLQTVGGRMGVKASGGIRDWKTAVNYLEQGCTRLGIGATQMVLEGGIADGTETY